MSVKEAYTLAVQTIKRPDGTFMPDNKQIEIPCMLCGTSYPEILLVDGFCHHCVGCVPGPDPEPVPSDDELTAALGGDEL
jgi:hypothetical protein